MSPDDDGPDDDQGSNGHAGPRVLVVEDDPAMRMILANSLSARAYRVFTAATGSAALRATAAASPELIVLDLGLPDMSGVELCADLRRSTTAPIIVVTADGAESRKVDLLDRGADDYVTKPFSMPELLARIRAAMRRWQRVDDETHPPVLELGDLTVDTTRRRAALDGEAMALTRREFELLAFMAANPDRILTHQRLLEEVWGPDRAGHHEYLRNYTSQLRRKLGTGARRPRLVTEPAVGYRMLTPGSD